MRKRQLGVGFMIGAADIALAGCDQTIRCAIAFEVIVVGIGIAIDIGRRDQTP